MQSNLEASDRSIPAQVATKLTAAKVKRDRQLKSQTMHVRMTNELHDALLAKAMAYDISISQLVRLALQRAADPTTKINMGVDFKR